MMTKFFISLLALGLFTLNVKGQGTYISGPPNIVQNGSFEDFTWTAPFSSWTAGCGFMMGYDGAADGRNFGDISSTTALAAQLLDTIPGTSYRISLAVSSNSSYPGQSIVQVGWDGSVVGTTTWTSPYTPGNGINFNWVYGNFDVVATSSSTLLSFQRSSSSTAPGAWLDSIQVVAVPEPSCLWLLMGSVAIALAKYNKRAGKSNA